MQNQVFSNYFTYSDNMQNTFLKDNLLLQAEKEAKEAEKSKQELGLGDGEDDLKALIQVRLLASVEDTCGTGLYLFSLSISTVWIFATLLSFLRLKCVLMLTTYFI